MNLTQKAYVGLLLTPMILGAVFCLSAWSLDYWQGWLFTVVFWVCNVVHGLYFMKTDPELVQRRMRVGPANEKRPAQRLIMLCITISFVFLLVVPGLDHRFGWSNLPVAAVLAGNLMVIVSFVIFYLVCRENSFASATIEINEGQKVCSTGLYHFIRHPMYSGALLMLFGMSLALGSLWDLVIVVALVPLLIWRIVDEENFLLTNLSGYTEYCHNVKFRLIPWVY